VVAGLENTIFVLLGVCVVGLFTRIVYPLAAAGLIVWTLVWIESQHSKRAHLAGHDSDGDPSRSRPMGRRIQP